jgi:hypothetical protein
MNERGHETPIFPPSVNVGEQSAAKTGDRTDTPSHPT